MLVRDNSIERKSSIDEWWGIWRELFLAQINKLGLALQISALQSMGPCKRMAILYMGFCFLFAKLWNIIHTQGTIMSLAAFTQPDIVKRVEAAALLSPISYLGHIDAPFVLRMVKMHLDKVLFFMVNMLSVYNVDFAYISWNRIPHVSSFS